VHALAELDEWLPRADVVASRPPPRGGGERRLSGWAHGPGALSCTDVAWPPIPG